MKLKTVSISRTDSGFEVSSAGDTRIYCFARLGQAIKKQRQLLDEILPDPDDPKKHQTPEGELPKEESRGGPPGDDDDWMRRARSRLQEIKQRKYPELAA